MSDLDVLRDLAGGLRPPSYDDLVSVARTRRRRLAVATSLATGAAVVAVALGVQAIPGSEDSAPPVGPSPSPSPSVTHQSPGPGDNPAALYDADGSLVLVTVDQTDRIATATLWRKDLDGWVRLGTLDRAAPPHWRRDSDGIHLSPGPGRQDLIATHLADERVGFSRDGGATWTYGSAPGTDGGCVGCYVNVNRHYVYWSTGPDQLWRLDFGADTAERLSLPEGPDPQTRYQFPLALENGTMISAEATGLECSDHYRVSTDQGDTWSERRALPDSTCLSNAIDDTAYACNEDRYCYGGDGVYESTDLEHWELARGLSEGWTGSPTCPRWSADREPFIEGNFPPIAGPLPAGDAYFALFHLNYSDGREILPRRGILQEDPPHEVEHVLMVSRDGCRTWKRVLR